NTPGNVAGSYTVRSGDTLQSIALSVWGDSAMWFYIADANGLTDTDVLVAGTVLSLPNKITNVHNNSGTFRPYSPGEAIGDTSPTLPTAPAPPKPKGGCGGLGAIIVIVVTVVVAVVAPQFIPALSGGGFWATVGTAALANAAGQVTGNIVGVQNGFDFRSFATAAISAGVTYGALNKTGLSARVSSATGSKYAAVAARAVVGNVIHQGVGNLTGSQQGFSWSSVAISGIGAAAGAVASDKLNLTTTNAQGVVSQVGTTTGADLGLAAVNAGGFALTQLVVNGGKVNWQQVATDTVTGFIQNRGSSKLIEQQRAAQGNDVAYEEDYAIAPKGKPQGPGVVLTEADAPASWRLATSATETMASSDMNLAFNADDFARVVSGMEFRPDVDAAQQRLDYDAVRLGQAYLRQNPGATIGEVQTLLSNYMESPETRQTLRAQGLPAFVDTETTTMGWAVRPDGDSMARELGGSSSLQARPDPLPWEVLASSPLINNDYLKVGVNEFIGNVNLVGMGANLLSGGRVNFEIASLEYDNPMLGTTLELALMAVPLLGTRKIAAEGIEHVLEGRAANSAEGLATRRAYLNEKFGRTGNLDSDITLRGYMSDVERLNISTEHGEAILYSGPGNRLRAEAFSRNGGVTLESTPGGAWLDNQALFKRLPPEQAILPWERLSQRYAQGASGPVNVFIDGASPRGVFTRIELPALYANPNVPMIIKNGVQPIRIK
ncbi:LysM peptidoglycan-binding domain-containing protein, partial [Pseudomethylobacillus aquaticus]